MKLAGRDALRYFAKPDPGRAGLLLYGADPMRVAHRRQEVISALTGPGAEEEMRLTRIAGADLRKDPAQLADALRAQGFFAGPRAVFLSEATDGLAPVIADAMVDWREGDATLVVSAGALAARSALRKLFEAHKNAYACGIYDDPPSRAEIEEALKKAGIAGVSSDAMAALETLSRNVDPGDFRQTVEKIALYKLDESTPLTDAEVALCAPATTEAALDDVLNIVAEARSGEIGPVLRRLQAQGVQPVGLCIGATRHFRTLHAVASDPGGASAGIGRLRPPVFGPRRDRIQRQAQTWGMRRLELALRELIDTDLQLRSSLPVPAMAVMERTLIRISMMARNR